MTPTDAPLARLFAPCGIAILGASTDPERVGGRPLAFLRKAGYAGGLYPVNPKAREVQGLPAYVSLAEVPGPVDLVVIALAAGSVPGAIEECIERGVPYAVLFSAGLGESDEAGGAMERALAERARRAGLRILGPNSLGLFCPATGVYATFATALDHAWPVQGPVAFATQSGAFSSYCFALVAARGLGVSAFAATGNESDLDVAALIAHYAADAGTRVVLAAMEGCKDGATLGAALDSARSARKPVVIMKTGTSAAGQRAAASHTGSLAGEDAAFRAFFRAHGAWQCDDLEQFVDVAEAAVGGRFAAGRRLGVVTTSGGIGVLLADAASNAGLELPMLPSAIQAQVRSILPLASGTNPVDTSAQILNDMSVFGRILDLVVGCGQFDSLVIYLAHIGRNPAHWARLVQPLLEARRRYPDMPMVLCMLSSPQIEVDMRAAGFIVQQDPTRAVRTLQALAFFGRTLGRTPAVTPGRLAPPPLPWRDRPDEREACDWLRAAGIPMLGSELALDAEHAAQAVERLGRPAALKILSPDIAHKSDVGGVMLDVKSAEEARAAYAEIMHRVNAAAPGARLGGVLVTAMERGGVEVIVGTRRDPVLGPIVVFGLGGIAVEALNDVSLCLAPVDRTTALEMIEGVRASRLLRDFRGRSAADIVTLAEVIVRVSQLASDYADRIDSIEINPLLARPDGVVGLDALVALREGTT